MDYRFLSASDQKKIVEDQLRSLKEQHYSLSRAVKVYQATEDSESLAQVVNRLAKIEQAYEELVKQIPTDSFS